jgi:OmpA-OmpF porin, OOP family
MKQFNAARFATFGVLAFIALGISNPIASAQTVKIHGMIKARSGADMIVQTTEDPNVVVVLTDSTRVGQIQGVLKARRKDMSMAALIPGLEVQVEGMYDANKNLVASLVKFQGNDLERAQSIQAGLHQTQAQAQRNREEIEKHEAELRAQQEKISANRENIAANRGSIEANAEKIAANRAKVEAAMARFGQLDDYYILDEVTVLFANGKSAIDGQYKPQLVKLAEGAKSVEAYMIQVTGHASSVGNAELNQRLSQDRANNVTAFLLQHGNIPMTNVLAPGAMGVSRPVADDKTAEGQAQNRRVVVRVLQNKGIAGLKSQNEAHF